MGAQDVFATVFDVQRNSFVDGPGIRTVIFIKGCNLRCAWCHNPEGMSGKPQYAWFEANCVRCGACVRACPNGALTEIGRAAVDKCTLCGRCEMLCPQCAIRIYGKRMSAGEAFNIIKKDKLYFETSGGGATLSGGECMLSLDFVLAVSSMLKEEKISVAIDTAGNVAYNSFLAIEPYADIFLYDLKAIDPQLHRRLTGVDNALILDNLRKILDKCPDKVIIRIPVVPGANETEMPKIAEFLSKLPRPRGIEPLAYHSMGEAKRRALVFPEFKAEAPDAKRMEALRALFACRGGIAQFSFSGFRLRKRYYIEELRNGE